MTAIINAAQMRAARGLLGWDQKRLAKAAKVGVRTVRRWEAQTGEPQGRLATLRRIQEALAAEGIEFIYGDPVGVLRHHPEKPDTPPENTDTPETPASPDSPQD
ncbi:MAG: helix-turn-helix domain-containing protein [Alphaproteobacteria bacterium]|jgi:transcriptional regulator with XRE-family HTH domain|nr:helix-turn-helix domain-containing protein [Alphaproteobacteria bacterium]